jgi:predicted DNA-binding WGR domain protein
MARFYALKIERSLFGDFLLVRMWGRIGTRGRARSDWFASAETAEDALHRLLRSKERRGYVQAATG